MDSKSASIKMFLLAAVEALEKKDFVEVVILDVLSSYHTVGLRVMDK